MKQLSTVLHEEWRGIPYVTCFVGAFDLTARTLTYTNAGHPPGLVAGRGGVRHLTRGGPPAGLLPNAEFDHELIQLHCGDSCLLVTDGVTEAMDGVASLERDLERALERHTPVFAAELCRTVMAHALSGHGPLADHEWDDDRTVVVVAVSERSATDPEMFDMQAASEQDFRRNG